MIHRAAARFRESRKVRAVGHPKATALPTRFGVVNSTIQTTSIKRHRVRDSEHTELFRLRIKYELRVRSGPSFDHGVLAEPRRVELIHPQVVREIGTAGFLAGALEFQPRRVPELPLAGLGVQVPELAAAQRHPNSPVRAEVNPVGETSWRRQRVILEFPRLWIDHIQLVPRPSRYRRRIPDGAIDRADSLSVAPSWNRFLRVHIDPHPGLLSTYLSLWYIVKIELFDVEFTRRGTAAIGPDPVLPIYLQVVGVVCGIDRNKFIGFRIVVTEHHVVTARSQQIVGDIDRRRVIGLRGDRALRPRRIEILPPGTNLHGHPDSAILIHHRIVRAGHPV